MKILRDIFGRPRNKRNSEDYQPDFESLTELRQIPSITEGVFNTDLKISKSYAKTIHRLLTSQTAFRNKDLYHSLRYIHLKQQDLRKFLEFKDEIRDSLFCVASMNSDGYVREKAVKFLVQSPTQDTFPFILFRLADWVPVIRHTAEKGIRNIIQKQEPMHLIRHHKIVDWLLKVQRTNLQHVYQEILEFIFSDANVQQIVNNLKIYSEGKRYFIFRNLVARNKIDDQIYEKILTDKNYLIRLLAVRNIDLIERPEILKRLLSDKSQKVRHYAILMIPESQLYQFRNELDSLLFDDSASIRSISRSLLSKIGDLNYSNRYRQQIDVNPKPGSIIGLSEVGDKTDLNILIVCLKSDLPKIRAAGLYAISNLDYNRAKEHAFILLNDLSNTVKKACVNIIPREKSSNDLVTLRSIYDQGTNEAKRFTLKIISSYGGWSIAGDFLKGVEEADEKIQQIAFALLSKWYNYTIRLGTEQKENDRNYVLGVYENLNFDELELPKNIRKIIENIPFIFGRK